MTAHESGTTAADDEGSDEDLEGSSRIRVGFVADPGLPTSLARALASSDRLADRLDEFGDDSLDWEFETDTRSMELDEDGNLPVLQIGRSEHEKHDWDIVILITDMTRRVDTEPVVADYSNSERVALVSVPALGSTRQRQRAEDVIVTLLAAHFRGSEDVARPRGLMAKVEAADEEIHESFDEHLVLSGARGRFRMLSGMVRANRPWLLVPQLSPAIAAAAAGAAFGVFYSNIWTLADSFSTLRLAVVALLAVVGTAVWLIADNNLWERSSDRSLREELVLYNVSTIVTISFAVICMYVLLYAGTLVAVFAVIPSSLMESTVRHSVDPVDYLRLAWLCVSMGALAGALGSGFAGEDAVRKATYSKRSAERREQFHRQQAAEEEGR